MPEFGWDVYAIGIFAALFAGVSKGGFGSGAAFAGSSILALFVPPGVALGIMLPLLMLIDATSLRAYWKRWNWTEARRLIIGAVPGVAIGAGLYSVADADVIRLLIGSICLLFILWQVSMRAGIFRASERPLPGWVGSAAGASSVTQAVRRSRCTFCPGASTRRNTSRRR